MADGKFQTVSVTKIKDLISGEVKELPESDVTVQSEDSLVQLRFVDAEEDSDKFVIKPGCFSIDETMSGCKLNKMEIRKYELLKSVDNTDKILTEANKFFSKLEVYKTLNREPRRAILLCSPPGVGKTSAINEVCNKFLEDEGTCVVIWDTSDVSSTTVSNFFLKKSKFNKKVSRLILVMEDIGGGTVEEHYGSRGVDSSLLNLLDGVGKPFNGIPTFIISTTNNPEQSVGALIDRPGRFDKVVELNTPNKEESVDLLEFIAKRKLTEEEIEAGEIASKNKFSIAHLQEIVVRSVIDDSTFMEVTLEMIEHKKKFAAGFQETKKMGL